MYQWILLQFSRYIGNDTRKIEENGEFVPNYQIRSRIFQNNFEWHWLLFHSHSVTLLGCEKTMFWQRFGLSEYFLLSLQFLYVFMCLFWSIWKYNRQIIWWACNLKCMKCMGETMKSTIFVMSGSCFSMLDTGLWILCLNICTQVSHSVRECISLTILYHWLCLLQMNAFI